MSDKEIMGMHIRMNPKTKPDYLGDGVYACVDPGGTLVLTTGHHELAQADNVIYLEEQVIAALISYIERAQVND